MRCIYHDCKLLVEGRERKGGVEREEEREEDSSGCMKRIETAPFKKPDSSSFRSLLIEDLE